MNINIELRKITCDFASLIKRKSDNIKANDKMSIFSKMINERPHIKGNDLANKHIAAIPKTSENITKRSVIDDDKATAQSKKQKVSDHLSSSIPTTVNSYADLDDAQLEHAINASIKAIQKSINTIQKSLLEEQENDAATLPKEHNSSYSIHSNIDDQIFDENELEQAIQMSLKEPESVDESICDVVTPGVLSNRRKTEGLKPETLPTNRIDAIFNALNPVPKHLGIIIAQYDHDTSEDIIEKIKKGEEVSDLDKAVAEFQTTLNLDPYANHPEVKDLDDMLFRNINEILACFRNITELKLLFEKTLKLENFAGFKNLLSLYLKWWDLITNEDIAKLGNLSNLQSLHIEDLREITDDGFAKLQNLSNLQFLTLTHCDAITDKGLTSLASLTTLKSLTLLGIKDITEEGLSKLGNLSNLTYLWLRIEGEWNVPDGKWHISNESINNITKNLSALTYLKLETSCNNHVTDEGLVYLATNLPNLEFLDLRDFHTITDKGLIYLVENLPSLKIVKLGDCEGITNDGINTALAIRPLLQIG